MAIDRSKANWTVYVLILGTENHYYVGISTNVEKRIQQHSIGCGSKITAHFGVVGSQILETYVGEKAAFRAENEEVLRLRANGKIAFGGTDTSICFVKKNK